MPSPHKTSLPGTCSRANGVPFSVWLRISRERHRVNPRLRVPAALIVGFTRLPVNRSAASICYVANRILIVDDSPHFRTTAAELLAARGFERVLRQQPGRGLRTSIRDGSAVIHAVPSRRRPSGPHPARRSTWTGPARPTVRRTRRRTARCRSRPARWRRRTRRSYGGGCGRTRAACSPLRCRAGWQGRRLRRGRG